MWKCLKHQNIVPFRGATLAPLQFISDWMPGGDLTEYIKKDPSVDRLNLVGVPPVAFDPVLSSTSYLALLEAFSSSIPAT